MNLMEFGVQTYLIFFMVVEPSKLVLIHPISPSTLLQTSHNFLAIKKISIQNLVSYC